MPHSVSRNSDRECLGILTIPVELLEKIFQKLEVYTGGSQDVRAPGNENENENDRSPESVNDIKNCRLTCRRFNEVSSKLLVPTLEIDCSFKSMDRIKQISNHPFISKGVRTVQLCLREYSIDIARHTLDFALSSTLMLREAIRYNADEAEKHFAVRHKRFPALSREPDRLEKASRILDTWRRTCISSDVPPDGGADIPEEPQPGDTLHRRLFNRAFQEYQTLYYIQQSLVEEREIYDDNNIPLFLPQVAAALVSLPCLRNLTFTLNSPTKVLHKTWQRLLTDITTDLNTIIYQAIILEPAENYFLCVQRITPRLGHIIPRLLAALSNARHLYPDLTSRLEVLNINLDDFYIRHLAMSPSILPNVCSELRRLKSFTFCCGFKNNFNNMGEPATVGASETDEDEIEINHIILNDFLEIPLASPALECFSVKLWPRTARISDPLDWPDHSFPKVCPALLSRQIPFITDHNKTTNLRSIKLFGVGLHEEDLEAFLETAFPSPPSTAAAISSPTGQVSAWPPEITTELKLIKTRLLSGHWSTTLASLRDARRRIGPGAMFTVRIPTGAELESWDEARLDETFGVGLVRDDRITHTPVYESWSLDSTRQPRIRQPLSPCWEYLNEHLATEAYVMDIYREQGREDHRGRGGGEGEGGERRPRTLEEIKEFFRLNPRVIPNPVFWDPNEARPSLPFEELFGDDYQS